MSLRGGRAASRIRIMNDTRLEAHEQTFMVTEQSLRGNAWRLTLAPDSLRLDGPEGAHFDIMRGNAPDQLELVKATAGAVILTVKTPKRLVFRLDAAQRAAMEQWLGPATQRDLQAALKKRFSFGLALGVLFIISSLPVSGDPDRGVGDVPFDVLFFTLGLVLIALRVVMKLWPHPILFVVDSLWFLALGAKVVYDVAYGSHWLWLFVPLFCVISAYSGFGQYARFKNVQADSGSQPGI